MTKLYVATLDRAPDAQGLDYWVKLGLFLEEIAKSFFDQPELDIKYPKGTTNKEFIEAIYNNLFKRVPDDKGWDYWAKELDNGTIPRSLFILSVINGAFGDDAKMLNNKASVGLTYALKNKDNISDAIDIIKEVTIDSNSVFTTLCKYKIVECGTLRPCRLISTYLRFGDILRI